MAKKQDWGDVPPPANPYSDPPPATHHARALPAADLGVRVRLDVVVRGKDGEARLHLDDAALPEARPGVKIDLDDDHQGLLTVTEFHWHLKGQRWRGRCRAECGGQPIGPTVDALKAAGFVEDKPTPPPAG